MSRSFTLVLITTHEYHGLMQNKQKTTHFGYQEVPVDEKVERVTKVFHSVAAQYDLMNDLMSLGIHRIWKKFAINTCNLQKGHTVLDLAGGTADLTAKISPIVGDNGKVFLADINIEMLKVGKSRLLDKGLFNNINIVQANAECLPFPDNYFDRIIIGFGLRNVTDKDKALRSMFACLKPGGKLIILEFSTPTLAPIRKIYDTYSFKLLPKIGKVVAKDEESYRYLAESIRMHPDQETLKTMMTEAGFEDIKYNNLSAGIVAVHTGYKY